MTHYNDAERQAGVLILSQFKMFNEATVLFEQQIEPAFSKGFDQCVLAFIKNNNWGGEAEFTKKGYLWCGPLGWLIADKEWKYWFETHFTVSEGNDFYLAVMTNTHTESGIFGFQFALNAGWFGGAKKLNAYASNIPEEYRKKLESLTFVDQGKGKFFLPVTLDVNQLTECWQENGEFPAEHEVFTPLRDALDRLRQSAAIFDAIFSSGGEATADQ